MGGQEEEVQKDQDAGRVGEVLDQDADRAEDLEEDKWKEGHPGEGGDCHSPAGEGENQEEAHPEEGIFHHLAGTSS